MYSHEHPHILINPPRGPWLMRIAVVISNPPTTNGWRGAHDPDWPHFQFLSSRELLGPNICCFSLVQFNLRSPIWFYTFSSLFKHPTALSTSSLSALTSAAIPWREQTLADDNSCELPPWLTPTTCWDSYPPPFPPYWGPTCPRGFDPTRPSHRVQGIVPAVLTLGKLLQCTGQQHRGVALNPLQFNLFLKIPHIYITHEMFLPKLFK